MVTRQPRALVLTSPMPRPQRFRQLVTSYCMKISRRRRIVRESIEVPPPLPPKDRAIDSYKEPSLIDMQSEYAAHVVFLTQIDSEASHSYPGPTYAQSVSSQVSPPPKPPKMQPYPPMPTSVVMPRMLSYAELKRRREAAAQRRVADVQEAEHEETERQVRLKHEKENFERQLAEEEQRRKLVLEEELRHAALVKKQKDELERREEEERQRLLEERRSLYHLRRIQQTQKLQEWRCERVREAEEAARRKMEMRRNVEAERRARPVPCVYASDMEVSDYFNGWVTIQTSGSLAWRRRFCRVQGSMMHMYKDATSALALDRMDFSLVRSVKEQEDGCEELQGLPHSFMLMLSDESACSMFTDNARQKEELMSLIIQVSNV